MKQNSELYHRIKLLATDLNAYKADPRTTTQLGNKDHSCNILLKYLYKKDNNVSLTGNFSSPELKEKEKSVSPTFGKMKNNKDCNSVLDANHSSGGFNFFNKTKSATEANILNQSKSVELFRIKKIQPPVTNNIKKFLHFPLVQAFYGGGDKNPRESTVALKPGVKKKFLEKYKIFNKNENRTSVIIDQKEPMTANSLLSKNQSSTTIKYHHEKLNRILCNQHPGDEEPYLDTGSTVEVPAQGNKNENKKDTGTIVKTFIPIANNQGIASKKEEKNEGTDNIHSQLQEIGCSDQNNKHTDNSINSLKSVQHFIQSMEDYTKEKQKCLWFLLTPRIMRMNFNGGKENKRFVFLVTPGKLCYSHGIENYFFEWKDVKSLSSVGCIDILTVTSCSIKSFRTFSIESVNDTTMQRYLYEIIASAEDECISYVNSFNYLTQLIKCKAYSIKGKDNINL